MQGPPCIQCGKPVEPSKPYGAPKRGWRIIDGVKWRWFCSRACSGIESGKRNVQTGLLARGLLKAAAVRNQHMHARRHAFFSEESAVLARYGVPRDLAVATLDRVWRMGQLHERGRQRKVTARTKAA